MTHTSSTHVDVRNERPETTTQKTTETTANTRPQPSLGHATPCRDVRAERPEKTTTIGKTTAYWLPSRRWYASPSCRDARPMRPEETITDYRPERNLGKTAKSMPRPRPNPRNETPVQWLRDRLPPPDIPDRACRPSQQAEYPLLLYSITMNVYR